MLYPSHDASAVRRSLNYLSFGMTSVLFGLDSIRRSDVVYVYHPPISASWVARALRRWRGTPFVLHVQDLWPDSVVESSLGVSRYLGKLLQRLLALQCSATYAAASHIIVISPGMKSALVQRGVPASKVTVILNWAPTPAVGDVAEADSTRVRLGWEGKRVILYSGNIGRVQGLDRVLRAFAQVPEPSRPQLVFLGEGLAKASLERLSKSLGLRGVSFLDHVSPAEAAKIGAAADVHLVSLVDRPLFTMTIPSKMQAAMSLAKPVLMIVPGDAAKIVVDANAGLVAGARVDEISSALAAIAAMPSGDLAALGENGYRYFEHSMSLESAANAIEGILMDAMSDGSR